MTYATKSDLQTALGDDELIQLTDRADPPLGEMDDGVISRALTAADGEIDSYLAVRYTLPLPTVPIVLRDCAIDLTVYRLFVRAVPDLVQLTYDNRIKWLILVAAGKASLGLPPAEAPVSGIGLPEMVSGGRVFGRDEDF